MEFFVLKLFYNLTLMLWMVRRKGNKPLKRWVAERGDGEVIGKGRFNMCLLI